MRGKGREIANTAYTLLENPLVVNGWGHRLRLVILRVNGSQFIGGDASNQCTTSLIFHPAREGCSYELRTIIPFQRNTSPYPCIL